MCMHAVMRVEPRAWHTLGKHYILSINVGFKRPGIFTLLLIETMKKSCITVEGSD